MPRKKHEKVLSRTRQYQCDQLNRAEAIVRVMLQREVRQRKTQLFCQGVPAGPDVTILQILRADSLRKRGFTASAAEDRLSDTDSIRVSGLYEW